MSRYADPTRCPSCGSYANGADRCARCGVLLIGPTPALLLRILDDADRVLDGLREEARGWQYAQVRTPVVAEWPPAPAVQPRTRRRGSWTVGSTLLALGALCLVVAAIVFVSVSWGSLGLLGRTAVLGAVTATVGGVAATVTTKRLRGSAEALWSVFLTMLVIDYLGARAYGLVGLDTMPDDAAAVLLGVLLAVGATLAGVWADRTARMRLVAPEVGAGVGVTFAVTGLAALLASNAFWAALLCVVAAFGAAVGLRSSGLRCAAWYAAGLAVLAQLAAICLAIGETLAYTDIRGLVTGGAVQTLVAGAATYAIGVGVHTVVRRRGGEDAALVAGTTTAVAITPALALAYAPAMDSARGTQMVASVVLVVLAVAGIAAKGPWSRGLRFTTVVACLPPLTMAASWVGTAVGSLVDAMSPVWSADPWTRLRAVDAGLGPAWLAMVVLGGLALAIAATGWYADVPALARLRVRTLWAALWCGIVGAFVTVCLLSPPVLVVALAVVGTSVVTSAAARGALTQLVGIAGLVGAGVLTVSSPVASVVVWSAGAACAAAIGATMQRRLAKVAAAGVSAVYVHLAVVGAADIAGAGDRVLHLCLVTSVIAVGLVAQLARPTEVRVATESVAAAFGFVAIVAGIALPLGWQSAMLTALGAACGLVALVRTDRRHLAFVGGVLTALAYVLRLVASEVSVVEAYTLPVGVILLAVGYLAMRRPSHARTSAALLPGLALALAPSLPAVLIDPTTLRGLLLGLAVLAVLGAGAALKWQSPFVVGTALVAVVVVRHVGPYADAVPRWSLLALAGTVMLVVGVTWESRVRDARSLASFVGSMR